jgi:hypothetical protein
MARPEMNQLLKSVRKRMGVQGARGKEEEGGYGRERRKTSRDITLALEFRATRIAHRQPSPLKRATGQSRPSRIAERGRASRAGGEGQWGDDSL